MKYALTILALAILALLCAALTHAEIVDYTETVQNAPGGIGSFSWTVAHDGFILPPPTPIFVNGLCTNCDANLFTDFAAVSEPSNGDGCQITGVWMFPDYGPAPTTEFSPLCDNQYDSFSGGVLPNVGEFGTWSWQWQNPDGTENDITLSISDPPAVSEPATWQLLLAGFGFAWMGWRRLGRVGSPA